MQRLGVGELQLLMDASLSQHENPAIPTFSRVLYITKHCDYSTMQPIVLIVDNRVGNCTRVDLY